MEWRALHPSSSSISSWIRIRKISCFCSAEGGLTVSKGWSGKAMASCFYTKDWSWVHSTDPAQKKKHWRSPQSSTNISCRDWKLLHAIRSRKSDRIRSYKILCKTEKIKKYLPIIISPEKELSTFHNSAAFIYSGVLSGPFTGLVDKYSEKPESSIFLLFNCMINLNLFIFLNMLKPIQDTTRFLIICYFISNPIYPPTIFFILFYKI